jgi:capsular polysaccharide biosynthesis protein
MDLADERRDAPDFGAFVRRYWRPVVICTVIGLVLAGIALHMKSPEYTAHASVNVQALPSISNNGAVAGGRTQQLVNLDTEAQLAKSTPVATRVQAMLHSTTSPAALAGRVAVSVPANSSVMVISYTAHTSTLAADGAHDFAEAYLAQRTSNAQDDLNTQVAQYEKQLGTLHAHLRKVTDRLVNEPGTSPQRAYDSRLASGLTTQIGNLNDQVNQLSAIAITPGEIVADSSPPLKPSGPKRSIYLATGALLGLLVGLLIGVTRSTFDKRLRTPQDVADVGAPVLASLPAGTPNNALFSTDITAARAVQQLSSMVLLTIDHSSLIAVIGVGASTSNVVSNLAVALAQAERRVAVVCAGSESRVTAELFGADDDAGLSDVLYEHARLADVLQESRTYPGITVLTPGSDNDSEPSTGAGFKRVLTELQSEFDIVLVQTPTVNAAGDASGHVIAGMTDGALLVAQLNVTRSDRLVDALALLNRMNIRILGVLTTSSGKGRRRSTKSESAPMPIRPPRPARPNPDRRDAPPRLAEPASPPATPSAVTEVASEPPAPEPEPEPRELNPAEGPAATNLGWPASSDVPKHGESSAGYPRT